MGKTITAEQQILAFAESQVGTCRNWMDLHNALYGIGGKCAQLLPTPEARTAFAKTPEYAAVQKIMQILGDQDEESNGLESFSGNLIVRMPKTIHAGLVLEAKRESCSLNQLIVSKLSLQLVAAANIPHG